MRDVRRHKSDREDLRSDTGLTRRDLLRLFAGAAGASVLAGCAGGRLWSRRPRLVVWSCGGNYESLLDFNRHFEELAGCRVTYSSAPVEHLISVLASRPRGVDILVGRSGPGWFDLSDKGRLAGNPEVFALDPYVIIVPPGNPGHVRGLEDLKRPDVKTVYAPTSSGPSGRVVQIILQTADEVIEPGIWAGYVQNAIEAHDCGWKVFPPVIEGRAHASVTRLSMTTVAETKGRVEVIPVPVKVMASMKEGHGAIPQRAAPIAESRHPELGKRYIDVLKGELGLEVCQRHGYIHRLAPEAEHYKPLFKMRVGPGYKKKS
jgi:ABC-type molybdate transport system substrate-binding protein